MPESDDVNCAMLQAYQGSPDVAQMNAVVGSMLTSVAGRAAAEQADHDTDLFSNLYSLPDLFRKTRAKIRNLTADLDGCLAEDGVTSGMIKIEIGETTQIPILDKDSKKYARIGMEGKRLPIRLKLFHWLTPQGGEDLPEGRKKYHELLPEDLRMFISMNHKEPGFRRCDMMIDNFSSMNQKK